MPMCLQTREAPKSKRSFPHPPTYRVSYHHISERGKASKNLPHGIPPCFFLKKSSLLTFCLTYSTTLPSKKPLGFLGNFARVHHSLWWKEKQFLSGLLPVELQDRVCPPWRISQSHKNFIFCFNYKQVAVVTLPSSAFGPTKTQRWWVEKKRYFQERLRLGPRYQLSTGVLSTAAQSSRFTWFFDLSSTLLSFL